jgi:Fe-S-cluster containining protein
VDDDPRCATCGGVCCRSFAGVPLSWAEYERLEALGAQRLVLSLRGPHWLAIDGGCEFLVEGRCGIYAERPDTCRRFMCVVPGDEDAVRAGA